METQATTAAPVLDPTDPEVREAQTFPRLSVEMASRVAAYGTEERLPAGTLLYQRGDRSADFFLVLEGSIEIFEHQLDGTLQLYRVHGERQFSGELNLFNDRPALVTARTGATSRIVRVKPIDFRRMVSTEPDIGELMMRAFILRRVGLIRHVHGGVVIVGASHSSDALRIQRFLIANGYPHRLIDTEVDPDAARFLSCFQLKAEDLPALIAPERRVLRMPSNAEIADALGISESISPEEVFDVAVIGGGPAGLAAAVYAASEGLQTVVVEATAPGGQAGTSSKIENYLGFPTGISGQALAGRAQVQAQKFGARLAISRAVVGIDCDGSPFHVKLEDDRHLTARAIVIATGARYRKLDVPNLAKFEGQGIHYAATAMEAKLCAGEEVIVVGGGNSAGQAAVFLCGSAEKVYLLVRRGGLAATMSDYLVRRIHSSHKIELRTHTEVTALEGDTFLREVTWTNRQTGESVTKQIGNVFVMIGAEPNTEWVRNCVEVDSKGFIRTGLDADGRALSSPFATSRPGIYAVGDVRSGSVKRVASGVGEGSVVVQAIHGFLHPGLI